MTKLPTQQLLRMPKIDLQFQQRGGGCRHWGLHKRRLDDISIAQRKSKRGNPQCREN